MSIAERSWVPLKSTCSRKCEQPMKGNSGQAQPQNMALAQNQVCAQRGKHLGNHCGLGGWPLHGQQQGAACDPGDAPAQPRQGFDPDLRCSYQMSVTFQHQTAHFAANPGSSRAAIGQALLKTQIAKLLRVSWPVSLCHVAHR